MNQEPIHVTQVDFDRLESLVDGWRAADEQTRRTLDRLRDELARARVVDSDDVPPETVTLGSKVVLRDIDSDRISTYRLVTPSEAGTSEATLSILSPLGVSVLGYGEGDEFECNTPGGRRRVRVEEVLFQPESGARTGTESVPSERAGAAGTPPEIRVYSL